MRTGHGGFILAQAIALYKARDRRCEAKSEQNLKARDLVGVGNPVSKT